MKIAVYCNNLMQMEFFLRLAPVFKDQNIKVIFWSNRLFIVLNARFAGQKAYLLNGSRQIGDGTLADNPEIAFEIRRGILTREQAMQCVRRTEAAARQFFQRCRPDQLWLWNGCNLVRQTLASVCSQIGIQLLFFEVGNFPGKLFVDREGVNCRSWYVKHRNELRDCKVDLDDFIRWKTSYLESKRQQHTVPQARPATRFNLSFALDLIGFWGLAAITSDPPRPCWRTIDYLQRRLHRLSLDPFNPEQEPGYLFFPLQVSTDSQVLWNSDISQEEALRKAVEEARKERRALVVKPHPAEPHWAALHEIVELKKEFGFKLVGGNIFTLLQNCSRVVTLNSTAGMEAMLLGKPVKILGRAHYAGFDELDMAIYIQKYLLDIDFFSDKPIRVEQLTAILSRGRASYGY